MEPIHIVMVIAVGLGATAVLDLWSLLLKRWLGVPSPNYCLVGRWLRYMRQAMRDEGMDEATLATAFKAFGPLAHHMVNAGQDVPRDSYQPGLRLE